MSNFCNNASNHHVETIQPHVSKTKRKHKQYEKTKQKKHTISLLLHTKLYEISETSGSAKKNHSHTNKQKTFTERIQKRQQKKNKTVDNKNKTKQTL